MPFRFFLQLVTWTPVLSPLEVDGFSHSWVIVYFSRSSSFLYVIVIFTFSNTHTDPFLLICSGVGPSNILRWYHHSPPLGGGLICHLINLRVHVTLYILIHGYAWGYCMYSCTCFITLLSKYSFFKYNACLWIPCICSSFIISLSKYFHQKFGDMMAII